MTKKSKPLSIIQIILLLVVTVFVTIILPFMFILVVIGAFTLKDDLKEIKLERALEERYDEDFVVIDSFVGSANWLNAGPLTGLCYPASNENLLFKADYSLSNEILYSDEYYDAIVREEAYNEMYEILSTNFKDFFLDVKVYTPTFGYSYKEYTTKDDVSILSFQDIYGKDFRLAFNIAFNKNEISNDEEVVEILRSYTEKFTDSKISFECYFTTSEIIERCTKEKENIKHISNKSFHLSNIIGDIKLETGIIIPNYIYHYSDNIFYLYVIDNETLYKRFDKNGNVIHEVDRINDVIVIDGS